MSELVITRQDGNIVEIILNRPEKRNALNWPMMMALEAAVDSVEQMQGVRVVLLRAEGSVFSSGIDLTGFDEVIESFGENWRENLFPFSTTYQRIFSKLERCSLPVIALLHNNCLGMGFELALACDFRIAAEGTQLGLPESRLGLIPDVGGTTRLTRLVGPARAKELIMTGRQFDLDCAERWGIVNYVVPAGSLLERGRTLAGEIAQAAPLAVSYAKRVIDGLDDIERGLQLEAWAQSILIRTNDFEKGAQAILMKQQPVWEGK
jgi:enoyl-CoA hydratase/carnithine racemase